MNIAIIGSGISGLAAAHRLRGHGRLTLFEADARLGGHAHTVDVTLPGPDGPVCHGVDTGFLVYNHRTYPLLIELFRQLGVETAASDMSFSVQVPGADPTRSLEWSGSHLGTVFAQKRNLINPRFHGMLWDLLRFNRLATRLATEGQDAKLQEPLGQFLERHRFGQAFRDWYLLPMLACIWSCPTDQMLRFPVATMIRFCHNHGLLQVTDRPQWYTVRGGSRHYVERIAAGIDEVRCHTPVRQIERDAFGVTVHTDGGAERFDALVLATHSDQALSLLRQPSRQEAQVLGAIRYQPNQAVLHTDVSVMPQRVSAWAAWNYERSALRTQESRQVCLHYWLNRLQPLPFQQPLIESLNPVRPIAPEQVLAEFTYHHPVFDLAAIAAQRQLPLLQGQQRTWYCGAWTGYGFHEDGLRSGILAADALLEQMGLRQERVA